MCLCVVCKRQLRDLNQSTEEVVKTIAATVRLSSGRIPATRSYLRRSSEWASSFPLQFRGLEEKLYTPQDRQSWAGGVLQSDLVDVLVIA